MKLRDRKIKVPEGYSTHHVCCPHDCPDTCSMIVTRDDSTGKAVRIQGDSTHPVTKGYLCNKVNHYLDLVYNKNRILYPHKRIGPKGPGARFERISWDEALTTVTDNFKEVISKYGSESVLPYSYSGTLGMLGFWSMDQRFWNKMEASRLVQSICIYAAFFANLHTYGISNGPSLQDASEDADLIILWGANLVSTGVHAIPFIQKAKNRGAKIIAIDPRKTRTTMIANQHIQPRPGTDAALALGMMKVIVDENLHDIDFLKNYTIGWQELIETKLPDYDLATVENITGVNKDIIKNLALEYSSTKKSHIRANYGLNRHSNSGQMCRSVLVLPCITGAWREKCGGAGFGNLEEMWQRFDLKKLQRPDLGDRGSKRAINMVQIGQALADNIGSDGTVMDKPIHSLFVYNSDPANCAPNSNNVRKGMMRDDLFITVHDTVWTDSCDYADIVLPADTQLERTDLHAAYGHYHYNMNTPVIEPLGESVRNTELFRMLAKKMGYDEVSDNAFTQTDEEMIKDILCDEGEKNPLMEGITYDELKENGWMRASVEAGRRDYLKHGWPTKSGKIEIWSEKLKKQGLDPLPTHTPEIEGQEDYEKREKYPIQVLSTATHYFIGDSFQSIDRHKAMMSRPTIEINKDDAANRNIQDGDLCRIFNDRGESYAYAVIVDGIIPGVCGTQKQYKGADTPGGVNINALNSENLTDFGMSPTFYSCLVQIEKSNDLDLKKKMLKQWGGKEGYINKWRELNPELSENISDEEIINISSKKSPGVFE